eukprot:scaffold1159_cov215-Pinguiococcus_pyrenoidosus.AAC.11
MNIGNLDKYLISTRHSNFAPKRTRAQWESHGNADPEMKGHFSTRAAQEALDRSLAASLPPRRRFHGRMLAKESRRLLREAQSLDISIGDSLEITMKPCEVRGQKSPRFGVLGGGRHLDSRAFAWITLLLGRSAAAASFGRG